MDNLFPYTVIQHEPRKKLKLTNNEYCVADFIHWAANNPKNKDGYCYASQQKIADTFGLSRKAVNEIVSRLVYLGIIERQKGSSINTRTTIKWFDALYPPESQNETVTKGYTSSNQRLQQPVTKGYSDCNQRLHNINNTNKESNNDNTQPKQVAAPAPAKPDSLEKRKESFYNRVLAFKEKNPAKYPPDFYTDFFKYWTEKNEHRKGDKMRFESQQFFEIGRRLATFWNTLSEDTKAKLWDAAISNNTI